MPKTPKEKKEYKKGIKKGKSLVNEGLPGWFGTFADMMTLLFAFFVLLAAISTIDPVKLMEMANSTGKSLGTKIKIANAASNLTDVKDNLEDMIEELKKESEGSPPVEITTGPKGVTLEISGDFSFGSGSANLKLDLKNLLKDHIVPQIKNSIFQIEVAGHTDSDLLPEKFHDRFPSNWELASSRASAVVREVILLGVDPTRLIATGYAHWAPRDKDPMMELNAETIKKYNATIEKKARNRRVEITFLKPAHHSTKFIEQAGSG